MTHRLLVADRLVADVVGLGGEELPVVVGTRPPTSASSAFSCCVIVSDSWRWRHTNTQTMVTNEGSPS